MVLSERWKLNAVEIFIYSLLQAQNRIEQLIGV